MDMDQPSRELELIAVVRELVRELAPQRLKRGDVTLASRLDRDLGIDSLGAHRTGAAHRAQIPRAARGHRSRRDGYGRAIC